MDLICVCDIARLMTILESIHSVDLIILRIKHRYDPVTCVLLNQGVSILYKCQIKRLCVYDVTVFDVTIKL